MNIRETSSSSVDDDYHLDMQQLWLNAISNHPEVRRLAYTHDAKTIFLPEALIEFMSSACGGDYATIPTQTDIGRHLIYGFTSLDDAVYKFDYIPRPYSVVGQYIYHVPFNARIPVQFKCESDLKKALLDILCGKMVASHDAPCSFTWENQKLIFSGSFDLNNIYFPLAISDDLSSHYVKSAVQFSYKPGFDLLTRECYDQIVKLSIQWERFKAEIEVVCHKDIKKIFYGLKTLKMYKNAFLASKSSGENFSDEIHCFYPELFGIDSEILSQIYSQFRRDLYNFNDASDLTRDENFIYYVLGNFVLETHAPAQQLIDIGKYCGYMISQDHPLQNAIGLSLKAHEYQLNLSSLCSDINKALDFLHNHKLFKGFENA